MGVRQRGAGACGGETRPPPPLTYASLPFPHFPPPPFSRAGLDEAFENRAAKAGFVERQAFLARVDDRQAEGDRARRIEERRARDMAAASRG